MTPSTLQAKLIESTFLDAFAAKLHRAPSRLVPGRFFRRLEQDRADKLKAALADRRLYDRGRLDDMPHSRSVAVYGYDRRWFFRRRLRSVTIATVVAPPDALLEHDAPPPVDAAQLRDHIQSLGLTGSTRASRSRRAVAHLIGVCSPSGFAPDVWTRPPEVPGAQLVLIEPGPDGAWRTAAPGANLSQPIVDLFDPETRAQKMDRVRREIDARAPELLNGGLAASTLVSKLNVSPDLVRSACEAAVRAETDLRLSSHGGELLLFRGAVDSPRKEGRRMSLAEWVKSLFARQGEESRKIDVLAERRAALSARLDRMYVEIGALEQKEAELLAQGKAAPSHVSKRRVAAQIAHLRTDISRANTMAALLGKQINILSTHIHNLELAQRGKVACLPTSDELTEAAVDAEEILEEIKAGDDLVSGLEVGQAELSISEAEVAILRELEALPPLPEPEPAKPEAEPVLAGVAEASPPALAGKAEPE